MDWLQIAIIFGLSFTAVALGTWPVLKYLRHKDILDHPNSRSSHDIPTPRGGGLIIIPVLAITWIWFDPSPSDSALIVSILAIIIGIVNWIDDLRGLSVVIRLTAQVLAVALTLWLAPFQGTVFQGLLPPAVDVFLTALLWIWFINLFNFMDGIDGISAVEALIIGLGVLVILAISQAPVALSVPATALCGVAAGFLIWNWHPAKIFLGDVGSASLGFMLGWLLLALAASGFWAVALILPGYYLADASITLIKRALRGERIWLAHKQHFYQMPVQQGRSHAAVAGLIAVLGIVMIACAAAVTIGFTAGGLIFAGFSIAATLAFFAKNTTRN